jgi:methyltransferase (TIGR00027 family)
VEGSDGVEAAPSRTALIAALARASLRLEETWPWVFDDPLALVLIGPAWRDLLEGLRLRLTDPVLRQGRAFVSMRARYAEDRLLAGAFDQYVLLGAGLDSLAWRRPDLLKSLRIFEIDHPASQSWKLQRVSDLALPLGEAHTFIPVDFENESLESGLDKAGFDWKRPTLFAWLGVIPYLSLDAIEGTLRTIAGADPGSEVIFDYRSHESALDDIGRHFVKSFGELAAESGESLREGWQRVEIEEVVTRCGLTVLDHPTRDDLVVRYFANRADGLMPYTAQGLIAATVGGKSPAKQ